MGWQPARPESDAVAWQAHGSGRRADEARLDPDAPTSTGSRPDSASDGPHPTRRPTRPVVSRWHRASRGRRTALAAAALTAVVALVTAVGVAVSPDYRDGRPVDGVAVADLRNEPAPTSWRIDPRADLGIPVDGGCLVYQPVGRADDDQLVLSRSTFATGCDSPDGDDGQRLARIDPTSGRVGWSIDAASLLDVPHGELSVWPQGGGRALVSATAYGTSGSSSGSYGLGFDEDDPDADPTSNGAAFAEVDLATGDVGPVHGSTREAPDRVVAADDEIVLIRTESRRLVESSVASGSATATYSFAPPTYTLFETGHLDTPTWSGSFADDSRPIVFGDQIVFLADGGSFSLDLATREVEPWGTDLPDPDDGGVVDDVLLVFGGGSRGERSLVTAVGAEGDELWSRGYRQDRYPRLAAGCIVFSDRSGTDCVEPATGDVRWTRPPDPQAPVVPVALDEPAGSRGDAVFLQTYLADATPADAGDDRDRELVALDGETGAELFRASTPGESTVSALGRTVGYALSDVSPDYAFRSVTAFDLASGARLWRLASTGGSYQFWAGSLVSIDDDGVVRGLTDPVAVAGQGAA